MCHHQEVFAGAARRYWLLVIALGISLLAPGSLPELEAKTPTAAEKRAKRKARQRRRTQKRAKRKDKQRRAKKKAKQRRAKRRRATRRKVKQRKARRRRAKQRRARRGRKSNMPRGWQWPPSPAMKAKAVQCKDTLKEESIEVRKARLTKKIAAPITVPSMRFGELSLVPTFRKGPFPMDCHLALALARASDALERAGVKELRFSSIHSYRRAIVNGAQKKSLSRHALGLAVDVYEVRDQSGVVHVVEDSYAESKFLKGVEDALNETGLFRLVLSPKNDPASHSDHFHLEARVEYE